MALATQQHSSTSPSPPDRRVSCIVTILLSLQSSLLQQAFETGLHWLTDAS